MLDLIVDHRHALRDHLVEQAAQFGNVPLPVAEIVDVLADRLVAVDLEGGEEGAAGCLDAEVLIQQQQRIGNRIDDALRLKVAVPQQAVKVFQIHHNAPRAESANR